MFNAPLVMDLRIPGRLDAEPEEDPLALRVEFSPESLNALLGELGWTLAEAPADRVATTGEDSPLSFGDDEAMRRASAFETIRGAMLLTGELLLGMDIKCVLDEPDVWGGRLATTLDPAVLNWAKGLAPLPRLEMKLVKDMSARWGADEWPERGAKAAYAIGRGLAQLTPGPAPRFSNARFSAEQLEHTLAAYDPEEVLRKRSTSLRGFALLALAAASIARDEALAAAGGDAALAQGPQRPVDAAGDASLADLNEGALICAEAEPWEDPRLAWLPPQACADIARRSPLARALPVSLAGSLIALLGAFRDQSIEAKPFSYTRLPFLPPGLRLPEGSPDSLSGPPFPFYGFSLWPRGLEAQRSFDASAADAAWRRFSGALAAFGARPEPDAAFSELAGSLSNAANATNDYYAKTRVHWMFRERLRAVAQLSEAAGLPAFALGETVPEGAAWSARKPRSL